MMESLFLGLMLILALILMLVLEFLNFLWNLLSNENIFFRLIGWSVIAIFFILIIYYIFVIKPTKYLKKANNDSEKDLNILIDRVVNNSLDSRYINNLLTKLTSSQAIDLFCQKWLQNRHEKLTQILLEAGYVATQPDDLRVLTALKVGKFQACIEQNPKLVKWLLLAFEDQDLDIASCAKKYAISLTNQSAIDELFFLFMEEKNQIAYQCIQQAKYQSTNIKYKAFFHLLRDELDAYDDLDFDQAILQQIYQSANLEFRRTIVEKARKRGWMGWLMMVQKNKKKMTQEEWEITLSILKNNQEFTKMWQFVKQSPIWVAQKLLVELSKSSYTPSSENNTFHQQLLLLANQCPTIEISEANTETKPLCTESAEV